MAKNLQTGVLERYNHGVLAYMQHMSQTAYPVEAKRLFSVFSRREKRRIEAHGGYQLPADDGHDGIKSIPFRLE